MSSLPLRTVALCVALVAAAALVIAHGSETFAGAVPCELCLWQRWPYRAIVAIGLIGAAVSPRYTRLLLWLAALGLAAEVALAITHVGVEFGWWRSPLPGCQAPRFTGGSIAERLAAMPLRPAKPCDDPTYLIPGLPLSMAAMNLVFSAVFLAGVATAAIRSRRA